MSFTALDAITELLASDTDADDILRAVVGILVSQGGCSSATILFSDEGGVVTGPHAGAESVTPSRITPVEFQSAQVAQLATAGCTDEPFLAQVATLIAPYCLVGWDTGGVPWDASDA